MPYLDKFVGNILLPDGQNVTGPKIVAELWECHRHRLFDFAEEHALNNQTKECDFDQEPSHLLTLQISLQEDELPEAGRETVFPGEAGFEPALPLQHATENPASTSASLRRS